MKHIQISALEAEFMHALPCGSLLALIEKREIAPG